MQAQVRSFLAIAAGVVAGGLVIFALEMLLSEHPPQGLDLNDRAQMAAWVKTLPLSAFLKLLLAYALGAMVAGGVTNKVAAPTRYRPALIGGFALMVTGIVNLVAIPHPMWFAVVSSLLFLVGSWLGGWVANSTIARRGT